MVAAKGGVMGKRKFSWTPILMALVAAFAAWVYFSQYKGGEEREKAKAEAAALLPFSNSKIVEFKVKSGATELIAKKDGETWKIEKPFADLGDSNAIDSFFATLSTEKIKETVVEAPDIAWKTYGLDAPVLEATISAHEDGKGPLKRSVQIGSVPAFDGSVYARIDGENRVVVLSSTAQAALQRDPRDLRDKHFFPTRDALKITSFKLMRPGALTLAFAKSGDVWTLKDGELAAKKGAAKTAWPIDSQKVKTYVETVMGLRGNDVWAEDKTDAKVLKMRKLDRPGVAIALTAEGGETYDVKIAPLEKAESVAAGTSSARPLVFSVYKAQIESLSKLIDDFRDLKFPFQFKVADVHAIELERPAGAVSLPILLKKDGSWIVDPVDTRFPGRDVKSNLVDQLMTQLNALSAVKILPPTVAVPKLGAKGSVRIAVFAEKNRKIAEYIFEPSGAVVHVTSSLTPGKVFEIEQALLDALTLDVMTPPSQSNEKSHP